MGVLYKSLGLDTVKTEVRKQGRGGGVGVNRAARRSKPGRVGFSWVELLDKNEQWGAFSLCPDSDPGTSIKGRGRQRRTKVRNVEFSTSNSGSFQTGSMYLLSTGWNTIAHPYSSQGPWVALRLLSEHDDRAQSRGPCCPCLVSVPCGLARDRTELKGEQFL